MRIAIGLEYDGTGLLGWQTQKDGPSVQAALESALSTVADEPVSLTCAGRTDAGVHATGQVAHFDTQAVRAARAWVLGANTRLPGGIALRWACQADQRFHARYSARARDYVYVVHNDLARSPLWRHRAWWVHRPLDADAMARAAVALEGEHDFSAFRAAECQARSPVRRVLAARVERRGSFVLLRLRANAFLHHMVRNVAGTLAAGGRGDRPPTWVAEVLAGRDRRLGGATAPPYGLDLAAVHYGPDAGLAHEPPADGPDDWFIIGPTAPGPRHPDGS
jgi:tRNA pseudouridine38-40 synthase